ncbi:DUF2339 domain-containing protein [Nevskia ramosa]|uniref:DUF2339 domain-containing protein n=1 Tax=Nevskia ramosa TaxID=64002 RepID=UPI002356FAB8
MNLPNASSRSTLAIVWVLLFGAIAAYVLDNIGGFWLGAFSGYLFGRLREVQQELRELSARLAKGAVPSATQATVETEPPLEAMPLRRESPGWSETPSALSPAEPLKPSSAPVPAALSTFDRLIERISEWARGGNPLARLGVLITFVGAVYLIRYAAETGYLPVELRLAGLSLAALAMVAVGWRLHERVTGYALTLQGGGLALLYLTVLAALRLYHLLAPTPAFALLVLVAASSALLAVRQNALPLAVIGFAGGFAAPLLLGGDGSHISLFGYYTVLNLGVFAIAAFRGWNGLNLLGFVFTFVITSLWRVTTYRAEWFASVEFFLLLFFVLYVFVTVLSARSERRAGLVSGTLTFGLPAVVLSLQASLVADIEQGLAASAAGFGLFYLITAAALFSARRDYWRITAQAFIAIGVVLLSLAVPLYFDEQATSATWALEGAGAVWLGLRQQQFRARAFGVIVQLLAGGSLVIGILDSPASSGWFEIGVPGAALLAFSGIASGHWLRLSRSASRIEQRVADLAAVWALGWWLYALFVQIDHSAGEYFIGVALAGGALTAAALALLAQRLVWPWLARLSQLSFLLFAGVGLIAALVERPSGQGGVFGWFALLTTHYVLLWRSERHAPATPVPLQEWPSHIVPALLKTWLASLELAWHLRSQFGGDWPVLAWGLVPAFALGLFTMFAARWPVARDRRLYALGVSLPLAIWLLGWVLVTSLESRGSAAPLITLPLLDPLDLSVLVIAAALLLFWRQRRVEDWQWLARLSQPWLMPAAVATTAFVWLNGAIARGLHYSLGMPLGFQGMLDSALLQATWSVVWSVLGFGAMWLAARRIHRGLWLAGAALMVIVAIKLFAVDTAGTGTLARIAAFLSVGVILLAAGYFAPLPAATTERS